MLYMRSFECKTKSASITTAPATIIPDIQGAVDGNAAIIKKHTKNHIILTRIHVSKHVEIYIVGDLISPSDCNWCVLPCVHP